MASSLLKGKPTAHPRLADGVSANEGDAWLAPGALELRPGEWPRWDLGEVHPLRAGSLQADNNDAYIVSVSDDGFAWRDVWTAPAVPESGLRTRTGTFEASGRYVSLRAEGGDAHFSATELALYDDASALWGPLPRVALASEWASLVVATVIALGAVKRGASWRVVAGVGTALALAALWVVRATWVQPLIEPPLLDWIRPVAAACALAAVALLPRTSKALATGVLAGAGALAVLVFLNFGRPQFHDAGKAAPTFLHHYDLRIYFPIAHYFPELGFDGVYAASAAVIEEETGMTAELSAIPMTNLRTGERKTVGALQDQLREVRGRFSDVRWAEFRKDMQYFRKAQGEQGYLHTLQDMGGNATPVWFLGARALFRSASASDATLWMGVIADILLMLGAFAAIGWAYGPRTALMAAVIFGAVDLYMFGSNWFGSTLRHDWMALWAIAVALLKKDRFATAGAVIAWAGLIRVFPIISLLTVLAPAAWGWWTQRRAFDLKPFVRFALGGLASGLTLLALSIFVFGWQAWPLWADKILGMAGGRGINTVGLTNLVTHPVGLKLIAAPIVLAALFALRRATIAEAVAFGPALLAIVFSPMNYYLHSLFLLVVLGSDDRRTPWFVLLAMCFGGYWASLVTEHWAHFEREAVVAVIGTFALIGWRLVVKSPDDLARAGAGVVGGQPGRLPDPVG